MGFGQGLSGLKAASTSLDVISNNIANASTVGFKEGRAQFADLYSQTMYTAAKNAVGIGVSVARVQQQFIQGNVAPTENSMDMAINGSGFFRMDDKGTILYTRNGEFELTKDGFIENAAHHYLTGYQMDPITGAIANGAPTPIQIPVGDIDPRITTEVKVVLNLDSREEVITKPFDVTDPLTYNHATAIDVYDSLGNMHVLQTYYVRTEVTGAPDATSTWTMYAYCDGQMLTSDPTVSYDVPVDPTKLPKDPAGNPDYSALAVGSIVFDDYGKPITALDQMTVGIPAINGADDFQVKLDYTGTTQYGSLFSVNDNQQDGYASGHFQGFSVDDYGYVLGQYSNGQTQTLAQVVLTTFRNPNGLAPIGDNEWVETNASGAPITGTPLTGNLGGLSSFALESSTVDLTDQLVNMITAQRVYQANAQTIKTEDSIMNTLVNLR